MQTGRKSEEIKRLSLTAEDRTAKSVWEVFRGKKGERFNCSVKIVGTGFIGPMSFLEFLILTEGHEGLNVSNLGLFREINTEKLKL